MVAVQMSGGLGNQMFQYAFYLKLKSLGKEVKMDDFTCYGPGERKKMLDIFGVSYDRMTQEEYIRMTDSDLRLSHRIRRKLTGRKNLSYREKWFNFDPEILVREPALFEGYFQTEKYFADIKEQVREAFVFRNLELSENMKEWERRITSGTAISVHIRRGDYLLPKNSYLFEGICDDAYYEKAIAFMKEKYPDAVFFFFSNDPAWVKEHYQDETYFVVEGNDEDAGYVDMYLMSQCRHHILANSSFSWWGAWLNPHEDKTIAAPKGWLNGKDCSDIYTKEMIIF